MMRRLKNLNDILFLCFFFAIFLAGCSREARDKLLRTFIDGVPAPKEEKLPSAIEEKEEGKKETKAEIAKPQIPAPFFHLPFLENQCGSCHESKFSQRLISQGKELCFTCHEDFTKDKKVVHYPVSEGACIECHDPHQSPNKFILKDAVPENCFTCHDEKEIRSNPMHEEQNICTECHNVHASNEEKLLKE